MRSSLKQFTLLLGLIIFFTQCEKDVYEKAGVVEPEMLTVKGDAIYAQEGCSVVQTLWAGAGQNDTSKGTDVGTVTATVMGEYLKVEYDIVAPWALTEVHVWVGKDLLKFPKNGAPGQLGATLELDYESSATLKIKLSDRGILPGDPILVAAHGVVVGIGGVDGLDLILPAPIEFSGIYFKKFEAFGIPTPPQSYFQHNVFSTFMNGSHKSWCVDSETLFSFQKSIKGIAYSTYGEFPEELFQKPENFPAINWVINYIAVGGESVGGYGNYTMGDIQNAIWHLIENDPDLDNIPGGVGPYDIKRVEEIVKLALKSGSQFVPKCGQKVAILFIAPKDQITIIEYPVPCGEGNETIWGFGEYPLMNYTVEKKWGWIFEVKCEE
jgi:hypothetical protein